VQERAISQQGVGKPSGLLVAMQAGLLFFSALMLALAGVKFHSAIHLVYGGAWMILSGAALTVSAIDRLTGSKGFEMRIVITAMILSLTVAFLLAR
jgi:hypothetical protein